MRDSLIDAMQRSPSPFRAIPLSLFQATASDLKNTVTTRAHSVIEPLPQAPEAIRAARRMMDSHGRTILDLRISITDRCNFRCVYCMEPDVQFQSPDALLSPLEITKLARIAESLGVRKIRVTGGEPTLHPKLEEILSGIRCETKVEIAMITNAALQPGSCFKDDFWERITQCSLCKKVKTADLHHFILAAPPLSFYVFGTGQHQKVRCG